MRDHDDAGERDAPAPRSERGYPLLFKETRTRSRRGILGRLLALFGRRPDRPHSEPARPSTPARTEAPPDASPDASPDGRRVDAPPTPPHDPARDRPSGGPPGGASDLAPGQPGPTGGSPGPRAGRTSAHDGPSTPVHRSTLQMLPGRLVPADRRAVRQEIRFPRPSNPEQEVTLGWEPGEPPDHVAIEHPSLEMRHAKMRYRRGHWWIESLAPEHPVRLNGWEIPPSDGPRHLKDGDRIGLGDIELTFRLP